MKQINNFFLNLVKTNSIVYRKLDSSLWWISLNEYIILYNLSISPEQKLRRIDLADKIWLTASWVTRILLPMEKIWLIWREINKKDARVSYVILANWWKTKFEEAQERIDLLIKDLIPIKQQNELDKIAKILLDFSRYFK